MARHKLTVSKIKNLTEPGIYGDGDGLYLRVQSPGRRSWVFIWQRFGTRREIGLGRYGSGAWHCSLPAARAKAAEAREIIGSGGDPKFDLAERKAALRTITFAKLTEEYVEAMRSKWRGPRTVSAWERFARKYTVAIARVPVDKLSTEDVVRVLQPLWHARPQTANKVRERMKLVLDHAKARGLRTGDNPAQWKGHLDQILPPVAKLTRGHHAAMPFADVPGFLQQLRVVEGVEARALEFLTLTAVRSGEVRGAEWVEVDLDAAVWTIPAARMKSASEHRVPLSVQALDILRDMKARAVNAYVFPGQRAKQPLADTSLAKALRVAGGDGFTVHGMRSAFRDWVSEETNFQREVAEAALAHSLGDATERAYRRGDQLTKRRELMAAWADFCCPVTA